MAKKRKLPVQPPAPATPVRCSGVPPPDYLSFLEEPKVTVPPPSSWLQAPKVTIGGERTGDPVRRKPGPLLPDTVRDVPDPQAPSSNAPDHPVPFAQVPKPARTRTIKPKALTEAQKRTRKIRLWMLSQSVRPSPETYCRAMDQAGISPPPVCRRAGKLTFDVSLKVPALKQAISAEFSRLWRTRSPQ